MRKLIILTALLFITASLQVAKAATQPDWCDYEWNAEKESVPSRLNLPDWVCKVAKDNKRLSHEYTPSVDINPFFITGDFDGDHHTDIAIRIKNRKSRKIGLAIVHYQSKHVFIIGAGVKSGRGDDLSWFDLWTIRPKDAVDKSHFEDTVLTLKGDALELIKSESASAVLYWDRKKYDWYQTSD